MTPEGLVGDTSVCAGETVAVRRSGKRRVTLGLGLLPTESDKHHTNWSEA